MDANHLELKKEDNDGFIIGYRLVGGTLPCIIMPKWKIRATAS